MTVLERMCDIVRDNAGEQLRFFAAADPDDTEPAVLHCRDDLAWTDERAALVDAEVREVLAKPAYEASMDAENVNQIIKVPDDKVLFTGFVGERVAVAAFERGILGSLPGIVTEFREYLRETDVAFIALDM